MRVYHATTGEAARAILASGFRDNPTRSFNSKGELCRGVWVADRIMTSDDFSGLGSMVLTLEIPDDVLEPLEWPDEEGQTSTLRGWLVPADVLNRYPVALVER